MASDLLVRAKIDMSGANQALQDGSKSVKKYEQQIESAARTTGKFEKSIMSQMREARNLLAHLERTGETNSQAYRDAQRSLAELTDQMGDMQEAARMMASDTVNLDIANRSLTGLVSAMAALQSITALTGTENERLSKIMKGLQTAIAAVTAATVLANLAQKQFLATLKANPIGLVLTGVAGLTAALASMASSTREVDSATQKFNESLDKEMSKAVEEKAKLDALIGIAKNVSETYDNRKKAIAQINKEYPKLNASIDDETGKLKLDVQAYNDLATAIKNTAMARAYEGKLAELATQKIAAEEKVKTAEANHQYAEAHKHDTAITGGGESGNINMARNTFIKEAERAKKKLVEAKAELADINKQIEEAARKSQEYLINGTGSDSGSGSGSSSNPAFGSEEWINSLSDADFIKYWDWVHKGIMSEAKNKPIKIEPIVVPPEEEVADSPELLKLLENHRFEQQKKAIDDENALNASHLATQMQYYQDLYTNESLSYEERIAAYQEYLNKREALANQENQINDLTRQSINSTISSIGGALSTLGSIADSQGLQAAGIVAQAIASILQGYATATAQAAKAGPIAWAAFSAAGLAQVITMINQIKNLSKFSTGGIFDGSTTVGDYGLARVNKGEMILNDRQQANLFKMLNGSESVNGATQNEVVFHISGDDLVGTMSNFNHKRNRAL